jgi:hypothetical protein
VREILLELVGDLLVDTPAGLLAEQAASLDVAP